MINEIIFIYLFFWGGGSVYIFFKYRKLVKRFCTFIGKSYVDVGILLH